MTSPTELLSRRILSQAFPEPAVSLRAAQRRVEEMRGRRIRVAVTEPGGLSLPTGLWLQMSTIDLVWVDATLSAPHQLVTICHEFGHMLFGHKPAHFGAGATVDGVAQSTAAHLAGIAPEQATALLGRCGAQLSAEDVKGRQREHEAETLGRRLALPFLRDHQAELAALLLGH